MGLSDRTGNPTYEQDTHPYFGIRDDVTEYFVWLKQVQ